MSDAPRLVKGSLWRSISKLFPNPELGTLVGLRIVMFPREVLSEQSLLQGAGRLHSQVQ